MMRTFFRRIMNYEQARFIVQQAYNTTGLTLKEFDLQAIMRAYLGPGPIPITQEEQQKVVPFLARFADAIVTSFEEFNHQTYDFGKRAMGKASPAVESLTSAPQLSALLAVMEAENQSVDAAIEELDRIREINVHLLTHIRAVKMQTDTSLAGIQSLLKSVQPKEPTPMVAIDSFSRRRIPG